MTDRETPRPDIDLIECIADSLLAPAGIASVLIKEDLLACIAYIRAQDARIAALEAEEQSAERRGIERAAAIIAEHRDHTSGTCLLYIEEDIHALIPGGQEVQS